MRSILVVSLSLALWGCGAESAPKVKITKFSTEDKKVPRGLQGSLCYGVENATRVTLDPAVEDVWPVDARCFDVSPAKDTTYTLTAFGADGATDRKTVNVKAIAAPPRLYDLAASKVEVRRGETVKICFQVENATSVKTSAGRLDTATNCVSDRPKKTTTYRIRALGRDREMDSGAITVRVR